MIKIKTLIDQIYIKYYIQYLDDEGPIDHHQEYFPINYDE